MNATTPRRQPVPMIEGRWKPIAVLTFAQACAAASILKPYLVGEPQKALEAAERLARRCPQVDVVDCFCDGIALALNLPLEERPAAIERMHLSCQVAS